MAMRSSEVMISTVCKKSKGGHKIRYCSSWKEDYPWLSYDAAIGSILRTLLSIIVSLERVGTERSEPTAVGLAKFVKTYYLVACCHFFIKFCLTSAILA